MVNIVCLLGLIIAPNSGISEPTFKPESDLAPNRGVASPQSRVASWERLDSVVTDDKVETVSMEIQFGGSKKISVNDIPFKKGMTILDAMKYAKEKKKFSFQFRGKNDTAFLTSIDKVKNQGARGDNWIFRINKKLGKKSFGISKLDAGDVVTWTFGKYKP